MVRNTTQLRESVIEHSRRSSGRESLASQASDDDLDGDSMLSVENNALPVTSTPLKKTQFNTIQVAHLEPIIDDDDSFKENITEQTIKTPVQGSPARHKPLADITLRPYNDVDAAAEAIKKVSLQSPMKLREALLDQKPPEKRLTIHKLVLENFKSYAGRQEIGPFHSVSILSNLNLVLIYCLF
jgi:hypothetical protein